MRSRTSCRFDGPFDATHTTVAYASLQIKLNNRVDPGCRQDPADVSLDREAMPSSVIFWRIPIKEAEIR